MFNNRLNQKLISVLQFHNAPGEEHFKYVSRYVTSNHWGMARIPDVSSELGQENFGDVPTIRGRFNFNI